MEATEADFGDCSGDAGCNTHKRANHYSVRKRANDVQFSRLELFPRPHVSLGHIVSRGILQLNN